MILSTVFFILAKMDTAIFGSPKNKALENQYFFLKIYRWLALAFFIVFVGCAVGLVFKIVLMKKGHALSDTDGSASFIGYQDQRQFSGFPP